MEGERSVDSELWHACAGLRVSLPSIGSLVVYFPQGHSEQLAATTQKNMDGHIPNYPNLDSQLVCQLHNVALHADLETDEVFAQMTLHPLNKQEKDLFIAPDDGTPNQQPTDFFCKILTASDTSTHGGFSIPRRAAEKVFPPLDFTKQPPTQELHAKDLHDHIWTFRHIFRGQPKRHLLTTGWSVFVSAKRLVAGDSVLFIRDEKGQLLLGIRRANRQQTVIPSSVISSDSMHIGVLAAAAHAAATSSCFQVFYNPRTSPSEFVVPLEKYRKAMYSTQVSVGMRFRMVFETDDTTLRRYMGTITGIRELDPDHWPGSKWRNLEVGWDESSGEERPRRVSIWEIEPVATPFLMCPPFPLRPKRSQHTGLSGDGSEREESMKRCLTWLQGEDGWRDLTSSTFQSLGRDTSQLQQQAQSVKSDIYNMVGEATLQDFRHVDASKLLQQDTPQVQFKSLQQWGQHPLQQLEKQQHHAMWPQPNIHQHVFENNQQEHRPPLGLPQTQTPTGTGIQAQIQKPKPRPTPTTIPTKPQMQAQPLTQVGTQMQLLPWSQSLSYSYSQSQSQLQLPQSLPQTTPITTPPVMLSTSHLQSCTSVQHLHPSHPPQSLPQSQSLSYSQSQSSSQLPQSLPQATPTTAPPVMSHLQSRTSVQHLHPTHVPAHLPQLSFSQPQEYLNLPVIRPCTSVSKSESAFGSTSGIINSFSMQGSRGRFHSTVDDNGHISSPPAQSNQGVMEHAQEQQHHQLSIVWKQQQQAQEALPVLSSLAQLDNQSTGNWHPLTREINQCESTMPSNKQVGQSDTSSTVTSCLISIPHTESLVVPSTISSFGNLNKEVQCQAINENTSGSFLSPSGKFLSAATDVDTMPGAMVNGGLDEALLQRNCSWLQMSTHLRTYTKVYKAGSIGRSIDLSRLKCYEELRRELACMFNLEGQLDDPQRSCWQLVFVDNDGDILLIGDDPWDEFVSCVRAIKILSSAQVVQLNEEGLVQLASLPIPQQTRSSSENCHVWKDQ